MSFTKDEFNQLFDLISSQIKKLNESQIKKLLNGEMEFQLVSKEMDSISIFKNLIDNLEAAKSREDAENILLLTGYLKKDLVELAQFLQIHISRTDTKDQIIEKIIDFTFGVKSRYKAIKGLDLKRK